MNTLEQTLSKTLNFQFIHQHLFTSGQPTAKQLEHIKEYGVNTIINIALTDASNALANEDRICLELGLNYIQLPIHWELPDPEQALLVLDMLNSLTHEHTVWLHCAKNYRVSALMYLYRQHYMDMDLPSSQALMHQIWTPNDTWTGLIHNVDLQLKGRRATQELQHSLMQTSHFA
ncbi:protein tyrosine phosphatase family protein [Acinetobacter sp. MD2(2019)]|uniref:protein tyrosine phosphatase family protein n=1 Tax=Acinetobacter sp. MD2(2019) TaxID=2605273 RepID=UPI002D1F4491|nr:protein tyrosine phosphatase family protein [Acinetobacter sp. MD2(2019)]MEB3752961.1 protein tyrosine phosphatase family protein [Acinetobacter sp. MD2(2019)]